MIKNYLKTTWRHFFKNKMYSVINILGLSAGLASFIIILLHLNFELSYDKWDPELKKVIKVSMQDGADILPQTPAPLASFLAEKYPNAAAATSMQYSGDFEILLAANDKKIYQKGMVVADSAFLKVFPYKLVKGHAATALNAPDAMIISEELSYKLFGDADPVGKTVRVHNFTDAVITGVLREPDGPAHINPQIIMRNANERQNKNWGNYSFQTYLKLKYPVAEIKMEAGINKIFFDEHLKEGNTSFEDYKKAGQKVVLFTDAVSNIHNFPKQGSSNFTAVAVLLLLAILLLLAGGINFSNLDIAKSMSRAKEVGIRKVLGSGRKQLIFQFMVETATYCLLSLCLAILIVYATLPYINKQFNLALSFGQHGNIIFIIAQILVCLLFVTLLSGLYPALLLSRFNAAKVLKGNYANGKQGMLLRNSLIILQFMLSAFFIIAILVINNQIRYMQSTDKGFSGSQVMRIQAAQKTRDVDFDIMRNTLLAIPGISNVAKTTNVPGDKQVDTTTSNFKFQGKEFRLLSVKISTDFFNILKVGLVKGRLFTDEYADQHTQTAIINETAAKKINIADPVGKFISFSCWDSVPLQVVGVVKDFKVQGFESIVQPVVYAIGNKACMFQSGGAILVKLSSSQMQSSIAAIEQAWKKIEPDLPIRYSFLDDNFQQLFLSYKRLQQILTFFAFIAIVISAMGLFALTAFFAKQRTKEIGIRKVLGASKSSLVALLTKDFLRLVIVAIIITVPVASWALNKWLQTFAYRIQLSWWIFLVTGIFVTVIAILTTAAQAMRSVSVNPVKSLKSE